MLRTEEQFPFASPMSALYFIGEMAECPFATPAVKQTVISPNWQALLAIGKSGSGEIRIEQNVPVGGAANYGERLVIAVGSDFQLVWAVRLDRELLRLVFVSEGKGDRLWMDKCAVALQWEEDAPENLLYLKEWIDCKCTLARIRAGADDLRRSLSMHG